MPGTRSGRKASGESPAGTTPKAVTPSSTNRDKSQSARTVGPTHTGTPIGASSAQSGTDAPGKSPDIPPRHGITGTPKAANSAKPVTDERVKSPDIPPRRLHMSGSMDQLAQFTDFKSLAAFVGAQFTRFETILVNDKADYLSKLADVEIRLEKRVFDLEIENDKLAAGVKSVTSDNEKLINRVSTLEHQLKLGQRHEVENEQYSRKSSVRCFGLPAPQGTEDCKNTVCNFVNTKLSVEPPLVPDDIDICHRVGGKSERNTQTILCKFMRRTVKMRVLKLRSALGGSGLAISDDIAKQHLDYMNQLKEREDVSQVWFYDGKIWLKPKNTLNSCNPRLHCDINKLITDTLNKPARKR